MIVFGQGAMRCHPYLYDEITAALDHDEEQGLANFDRALFGHAGHLIANTARSLFLGLTRGRLSSAPGRGTVHRYAQRINWLSAGYALFADATLLLLGGQLKRREKLSGRLADILSDLYLASAVIKRYMDQGQQPEDLPLMRWACQTAIYRIQLSFYGLFANLPNQPLAWVLRLLIFPIGTPFTSPNDQLGKEVAELILAPGPARDRLVAGTYCHASLDDQQARLEDALYKVVAADDASKKIKHAQRKGHLNAGRRDEALIENAVALEIISREEGQLVRAADLARAEVIQVDDFDANLDLPTRQPTVATADTAQ
jgi:acyl-CoA dehydrogenase